MWSLDLSPATLEICYRGIQAAVPTAHRGERGASRRRGRASPVMQPVAGTRRTRRDGRSFPERQSLFLQHPNDPTRLYHGQPEHSERTQTHTQPVYCHHIQKKKKRRKKKKDQIPSKGLIIISIIVLVLPRLSGVGIKCAQKK